MAKAKKLASGSWRVQVYSHIETITDPDTGEKKEKRIYRSFTCDDPSPAGRRKAEAMAAEFAANKENIKIAKIYKVREAMEKYCIVKSNVLSPSTIRSYKSMIKNVYKEIEYKKTNQLTSLNVQHWVNTLSEDHSAKYVKNAYDLLKSALSLYQPDLKLKVKLPQSVKYIGHTPSDAEISRLIEFFRLNDKIMLNAVYLAAFGVLRRSAICAVDADNIVNGRLLVRKAMVKNSEGEWVIKTTKTYSSTRYVDLPPFVLESLPTKGRLVPIVPSTLTSRFEQALSVLQLQHFRFHDLRHYAASIMHALGIPDQYIMQQGGWKSDRVLKSIYRNALSDYEKQFLEITTQHFSDINEKGCNTKCNTK